MTDKLFTVERPLQGVRIMTKDADGKDVYAAIDSRDDFLEKISNIEAFMDELLNNIKNTSEYLIDTENEMGSEDSFVKLCCELSGLSIGDQSLMATTRKRDLCFKCTELLMKCQLYKILTDGATEISDDIIDNLVYETVDRKTKQRVYELDTAGRILSSYINTFKLLPDELSEYNKLTPPDNKKYEYLNAIRIAHDYC